ncbi:MAG: aspartate--tRNA ligase [Planctomycetia bacterium]|nr:aspartate--tRNA ligase [Planctomycetia bacterium]
MSLTRRTHTCGELRASHVGKSVRLNGWVNTTRVYNDQVFVDLRDRYGITQVVLEASRAELAQAREIGREWCLMIEGTVRARLEGKSNPKLATGAIEVDASAFKVLNRCPQMPFDVMSVPQENQTMGDPDLANEDLRLEHRYIDLRRPNLQRTLAVRHRMNKTIRDFLDTEGFLELETPLLGRSTPEGARDYLVPSRVFPGEWYALPQSPQIYKQLLMVSGYDKYFQIARCLRDEDLRADRQPEFTQLDFEMSFVEMDDVFDVIERLCAAIFRETNQVNIPLPIQRIKYADAMLRYGSDKPDLRYGMEIVELSTWATSTQFKVFHDALAKGGKVRALCAKGAAETYTRKKLDELTEFVKTFGAKGLAWIKVEADKFNSPIEKFLPAESQQQLRQLMNAGAGDLILFVADTEDCVCQSLGQVRTRLAAELKFYDNTKPVYKLAWIIDFPSFIWDEEELRWAANHHPFTAPMDEDLHLLESNPGAVRAKAYDLVINGYECGGGSIRIHSPEVQSRLFSVLGMSKEQAQYKFGFLLNALSYGAPPHGGIALGLDRWAMILAGTSNIRDVIAFPKNQRARDLMTGAPAQVDQKQLKELGLVK